MALITTPLLLLIIMSSSFMMAVINGQQISTACTSSMISTFTPCLNFITGSSGGSVAPTAGCCESLKSLMNTGMDCTCLILTANVPLPTGFINRTLSLGLPRACKMGGVPVQCQAAGAPLPAPGPVPFLLAPPPPAAAFSPGASKAAAREPEAAAASEPDSPAPSSTDSIPTAKPGIRPVVQTLQPNSLAHSTSPFLPLILILFTHQILLSPF